MLKGLDPVLFSATVSGDFCRQTALGLYHYTGEHLTLCWSGHSAVYHHVTLPFSTGVLGLGKAPSHLELKAAVQFCHLVLQLLVTQVHTPLQKVIFLQSDSCQVLQGIFEVVCQPLCTCKQQASHVTSLSQQLNKLAVGKYD